jgi:Zn-dependent protease with chaperone function
MQMYRVALVFAVLAGTAACDRILPASSNQSQERFELKQDSQGRVIRLDKTTGQVVLVDGTRLVPLGKPELGSASTDSKPVASQPAKAIDSASNTQIPATRTSPPSREEPVSPSEIEVISITANAPVFATTDQTARPLVIAAKGSRFRVTGERGDTYRVDFTDPQLGHRIGFVEKKYSATSGPQTMQPVDVSIPDRKAPVVAPVDVSVPGARVNEATPVDVSVAPRQIGGTSRPPTRVVSRSAVPETLHGYIEWQRDEYVIADGQRVRWNGDTVFQPPKTIMRNVPLGYEFNAVGSRLSDGSLLATRISVKPNGTAAFERETQQLFDSVEQQWEREGMAFDVSASGRHPIGRITESGPDVARIQAIVNRLIPPSRAGAPLRVRIIETKQWNASAMPNGAIWVNRGLLDEVSNDELAIVLGHELAHYTHEHSRRKARNNSLVQLTAAVASAGLEQINSPAKYSAARLGSELALDAWQSGYSRSLEDQADRVGLRYAFEGGFDVTQGPRLWNRVRERNGQSDKISNFFLGDHSRPSDRARNLEREISLNYAIH